VLYGLRHPLAFVVLVLAFLLGVLVRGVVQARLAARLGDRSGVAYGRGRPDLRRHLDPFGAVAGAIGGVGWGHAWERAVLRNGAGRGKVVAVLLAGPLALIVLGLVLLVAYAALGYPTLGLDAAGVVPAVVHADGVPSSAAQTVLLFAGVELLAMGLLHLVPLPPLDGGRLLFLLAPGSSGWQKAEYWLEDQNVGTIALLVLLIFPLAGRNPLLLFLLDTLAHPLLGLLP
jgi:Zn-dependent protease